MKILCMTYEYPPIGGGGANVAEPLAATLASRGHDLHVVTSGMRGLAAEDIKHQVKIHRVACLRRHRHYTTTPELATWLAPAYRTAVRLHKQRQFDVNHTHFALPSGLVSYLLFKRTGLPYVLTIHGSDVPGYNPDRFQLAHRLAQPVWRRIMKNSSKIVSASHFLKNLVHESMDLPVEIVRNGFDTTASEVRPREKHNRILVVSRMFRRKGVQHFIDALQGVDHGWEVVIAGDGPYLPELKEQVRRLNITVRFVGFVQGETLAELYGTSKIFVFPSLQENFPTVLLEAMQAGCAIVTTNAQGCGEVIGDAGIATDPGQPEQIRAALLSLLGSEERIRQLGAAAQTRIKRFGWPRIATQYETVLREAARSSASIASPAPFHRRSSTEARRAGDKVT